MKTFLTTILLFTSSLLFSQSRYIRSFKTDSNGGPSKTVKMANLLFFSAYDPNYGRELWVSDGTTAGTHIVKDINPGIADGATPYFELTSAAMNGIMYFRGDDGIHGIELWRSDGTDAGTFMVKDLNAGIGNSAPGYLTPLNNILYFTAGTGSQLCKSDGTSAGTSTIRSFSVVSGLTAFNNNLYFAADDANSGQELWKYNTTTQNAALLKDLNGVFGASLPCNFHAAPSALYFMAATNEGWELWKTTGTNASTVMVKDINPSGNGVADTYADLLMTNIGDTLYFRAQNGINSYQLWKSDGTDIGTVMLSNLPNGVDQYCKFPIVNGKIFINNYLVKNFWAYDPADGTVTETAYPSSYYFNSYDDKYVFVGDKMCYASTDSIYGAEVWKADGTLPGVKRIQETHLTDNWTSPYSLGFNSIFGTAGTDVLFTIVREPYEANIPLYAYDVTNTDPCFAPNVIVPVPVSSTLFHLVWNRIENAEEYELQFRVVGAVNWITKASTVSFNTMPNLNSNSDYEYRVRAKCNGSYTSYSDIASFNSSFIGNDYLMTILAERAENDSTERIYWLQSSLVSNGQIRYRPYGTTTWTTVNNANGYKRLTGLLPNTFYEYQNRAEFVGSGWDAWPFYSRFFVTEPATITALNVNNAENNLNIFPNPAKDKIYITSVDIPNGTIISVADLQGKLQKEIQLINGSIDISSLSAGVYILKAEAKNKIFTEKIIKL